MADLERSFFPDVVDDLRRLPSPRLQHIALERITDLSKKLIRGLPLDKRARTGNLKDCLKLYFDETGGRPPAWRIVYRLLPDPDKPKTLEVISVGPRRDLDVYHLAAERLGRIPE